MQGLVLVFSFYDSCLNCQFLLMTLATKQPLILGSKTLQPQLSNLNTSANIQTYKQVNKVTRVSADLQSLFTCTLLAPGKHKAAQAMPAHFFEYFKWSPKICLILLEENFVSAIWTC